MLLKKIICLLLTFVSFCSLNAQYKTADSLQRLIAASKADTGRIGLLYTLSDFYLRDRHNLDSASLYIVQELELSRKINDRTGEVTGLIYMYFLQNSKGDLESAKQSLWTGLAIREKYIPQNFELQLRLWKGLASLYIESNPDSSIYYSRKMVQLAQTIHNPKQEAWGLLGLGYEFLFLGNYPQALEVSLKAQPIQEKIGDTLSIAYMYRDLGNIYFFQNDFKQALFYYNLGESLAKKMDVYTDAFFSSAYVSKARLYLKLNVLDSALFFAQQCYTLSIKSYSNNVLARLLNILGNIYEKMGKDTIAIGYFREGISFSLHQNFITAAIQTYNSLAQYFYNKNGIDSCIFYGNKAAGIIKNSGFLIDAPETYSILSTAYRAKKNMDSTLKYKDLAQAAKDTLLGIDKIQQIQLIEFNQEQQKKQEQASELALKNRVKFYSLLIGIILLFLVAGMLWRSVRVKQRSYTILQKQKQEIDHQKTKIEQTLSDLKSTQAQLIQSEKMASLGELTAGIAHEIQNPLNFVNNFSEVNQELIEELKIKNEKLKIEDPEVNELLNDIEQNLEKINHHGKRADAIVKGMLQHSRSSSGVKEPTDINALCDEYLRLAYHGLRAKDKSFNATMKTDYDETIGRINVVPQDIGRAILNLITNAFYAVTEKRKTAGGEYEPTVTVSTKKIADKALISVADNGNGIPQKTLDKIFQPFFTTKPTGQGTGLGLSLSYDIVKAHGGELKVNTREKEFAEFTILLPL